MDNQKTFVTEDYDPWRVAAGQIGEEGIVFFFKEQETLDGIHGEFNRIHGIANYGKNLEEQNFFIDYSGTKLRELISHNLDKLMNKTIKICAIGSKMRRNYHIVLVESENEMHQDLNDLKDLVESSKTKDAE